MQLQKIAKGILTVILTPISGSMFLIGLLFYCIGSKGVTAKDDIRRKNKA